jgi:hypothetical protein
VKKKGKGGTHTHTHTQYTHTYDGSYICLKNCLLKWVFNKSFLKTWEKGLTYDFNEIAKHLRSRSGTKTFGRHTKLAFVGYKLHFPPRIPCYLAMCIAHLGERLKSTQPRRQFLLCNSGENLSRTWWQTPRTWKGHKSSTTDGRKKMSPRRRQPISGEF